MAGACFLFISRTVGTYRPEIFMNPALTRANVILSLLAAFVFLLFYILIFTTYAIPGKPVIKDYNNAIRNATITAIVGTLMILPLFLEGVALAFGKFNDFFSGQPRSLKLFLVLGSAICSLYFAAVFYEETLTKVSAHLSRAVKFLIFGATAGLVIRTYLVLNYYYPSQFRWSGELTKELPIISILIFVFIFFSNIYFLWNFYKELGSVPKKPAK